MALENNEDEERPFGRRRGEGRKKGGLYEILPECQRRGNSFKANHGMMDMSVIPGLLELSMMDDGLLGG